MSYSDLPLLDELLKPHICVPIKTSGACKCPHTEKEKHTPTKSLQHWEKWMNRRKKIHLKLAKMIQQDPSALVMNHAEETRSVMERRVVLENTRLVEYKGAKLPPLEYVTVPGKIMIEKHVDKRAMMTWADSEYFNKRCKELSVEISLIEPHKPDLSNLFIEGISLEKLMTELSEKSISLNPPSQETEKESLRISLVINDEIMSPTEIKQSHTRKVFIMFDYDVTSNKVDKQYLSLENTGNTAIHYSWESIRKIPLFRDILPEKKHNTYFCFNKNKGVIVPKESVKLPIFFTIKTPGVYCEDWEFRTRPRVLPKHSRLIVTFHASAVTGDLEEKMENVRIQLENSMRSRLIKEALSTVLHKVQFEKSKPTIYSYNKKEIFEAMSTTYDPMNLYPRYAYNKDVVRDLQKFYKNVRRNVDPKNWNYSIYELKLLTNAKQKSNEHVKYLNDQEIIKKLETFSPTLPPLDSPKTDFSKIMPVSQLQKRVHLPPEEVRKLVQELNAEKISLNDELEKLLSKLERPHTEQIFELDTHRKVYLLLCTCFNKIENEIENLKVKLGIETPSSYPQIISLQKPCLYERLIETFIKPSVREDIFDGKHQPANKVLQVIPTDDCVLRYRTYFHLDDAPEGAKKATSKKNDEVKKGPPKKNDDTKKSKISSEGNDRHAVNTKFDPYAKIELTPFTETVREPETESESCLCIIKPENLEVVLQHYKYYIYVIIYHYLDQAICSIIDMIEMYSLRRTPYPVIKEIEEPNYTRRLIDLKSLIVQENVDNLKAKIVLHNYQKKSKLDWKSIATQRELKRVQSRFSLWDILRPYEKRELYEEKPISYPSEIYEKPFNVEIDQSVDKSTSAGDGLIDSSKEYFKEASIQKDYGSTDHIDDLETYIEKVKSETSVHSLIDCTYDKETQKDLESHVSDEEHFYYTLTDSELSDVSIESLQHETCNCVEDNSIE